MPRCRVVRVTITVDRIDRHCIFVPAIGGHRSNSAYRHVLNAITQSRRVTEISVAASAALTLASFVSLLFERHPELRAEVFGQRLGLTYSWRPATFNLKFTRRPSRRKYS